MKPDDVNTNQRNPRDLDRSDDQPRLVQPARSKSGLFQGWGPKLF
jgi:hypothetical protein